MASVTNPGKSTPWGSIASLALAVIYGVSPIDLIPDIIPLLGWADDGIVGGLLILLAIGLYFKRMREKRALKPVSWRPK